MAITIENSNQQINGDDGIHKALDDGVNVRVCAGDTWTFPVTGADGRLGKLCVSQYRPENVRGSNEPLAVHVTFTVTSIFVPSTAGAANRQPVRVEIVNLHFTARPKGVQVEIHDDNFKAALPGSRDVATHRGIHNNWLHNDNAQKCKDIAVRLGLPADTDPKKAINEALAPYNGVALAAVQAALVDALRVEINDNLQPANLRGKVPVEVRVS
jgi:hypothetical protein